MSHGRQRFPGRRRIPAWVSSGSSPRERCRVLGQGSLRREAGGCEPVGLTGAGENRCQVRLTGFPMEPGRKGHLKHRVQHLPQGGAFAVGQIRVQSAEEVASIGGLAVAVPCVFLVEPVQNSARRCREVDRLGLSGRRWRLETEGRDWPGPRAGRDSGECRPRDRRPTALGAGFSIAPAVGLVGQPLAERLVSRSRGLPSSQSG